MPNRRTLQFAYHFPTEEVISSFGTLYLRVIFHIFRTEEVLCFGIERIYTHSKRGTNELSDVAGFRWQTVAGFRWQTVAGFRWRTVGQVDAMTSRPTSLPARAEGELSDEMSGLERV